MKSNSVAMLVFQFSILLLSLFFLFCFVLLARAINYSQVHTKGKN